MNVTREVILDLLPVYLAGEASPATRTLVEEYLKQDAELAQRIRVQWADSFAKLFHPRFPRIWSCDLFAAHEACLAGRGGYLGLGFSSRPCRSAMNSRLKAATSRNFISCYVITRQNSEPAWCLASPVGLRTSRSAVTCLLAQCRFVICDLGTKAKFQPNRGGAIKSLPRICRGVYIGLEVSGRMDGQPFRNPIR